MGGWMTYQRVRLRNNAIDRTTSYVGDYKSVLINGDLNRMEKDYLDPEYPQPPFAIRPEGSSPAEMCAAATGVDIDTVRKVLRYVFLEQP
jgi:hypothetical protein